MEGPVLLLLALNQPESPQENAHSHTYAATKQAEWVARLNLRLVANGISPIMLNATITALRFFFQVTLDRADAMAKMSPVPVPHTLPVVLSRESDNP